jgi:hypothetical protein
MNKNPIRGNFFLTVLLFLFIFGLGLNGQAGDRNKDLNAGGYIAKTADQSGGTRNVTGSAVNGVIPASVSPGTTLDLCFSVTHVDNDYEYLDRFDVDLPDGWTVNSVTNTPDNNGCGDGTTQGVSAGNVVYWQTVGTLPTGCGSWDDVTVSFCVNVTVPDCTGAPWTIPWNIIGDGYGGAPHSLQGSIQIACGVPTGAPVLVISPDSTGGSIASLLAALSAYPDYYPVVWNNASGNPTAADMAPYCAVVVGNNYQWTAASLDKTAIGNALADYLDGGGHVIESEFIQSYDAWGFAGRYMTGGYSAFTPATLDHGSADTMSIVAPAHPVMAGVTSIGDAYQQDPGLAAGATLLARWSGTSYNAVAVKPHVVALNFVLCDSPTWTGDIPLLLNNALNWLCASTPGPFLQVDGKTFVDHCAYDGPGDMNGVVEPGENINLAVTLRNSGSAAATGLNVTITSPTAGVTITDGTAAYADLATAGSGTNLDDLIITLGTGVGCLSQVTINMAINSNEGSWNDSFTLDVGQPSGAVTDFAENFNTTAPPGLPAGWATQVITGNSWASSNYNNCSAPNSLRYPYNSSQTADSYAYTQGIALQSGVTYTLNFNYKTQSSGTFPESLEVWVGTGQVNTSMTDMIWSRYSFVSSSCSAAAPTFTVPSTGTYYVGFRCVSAADEYYLYVDDINLTHPSAGICNICVCPTITVSPATLPDGIAGTAYSQSITASGGIAPYTYTVTGGSAPTGLTLAADGTLAGTPTATGTFDFTVTASDNLGCTGSQAYSVTITCPAVTISPLTLPGGITGIAYSQTITASGGTAPYSFAVTSGSLPAGLTLSSAGLLSGAPTAGGTYPITVTATDAYSCAGSQSYSLLILQTPGAPVITDISDNDACSQSGITIAFTAGSPATRHDLYRDGFLAQSNVSSPLGHNPADTASHSYVIRAVNTDDACFADSAASAFADLSGSPSQPAITSITDINPLRFGLVIVYTGGAPATRHDLYKDGSLAVADFISGGTYVGPDSMTHSYQIAAVNGTCLTFSAAVSAVDRGPRLQPRPKIPSIEPLPKPAN